MDGASALATADGRWRRAWVELWMTLLFVLEFGTNLLRHVRLGRRRCTAERDLTDEVCVVTGANSGIGTQTAYELARRGALVVMACRSVVAGERAKLELLQKDARLRVVVMRLDLSSLESVEAFARAFLAQWSVLHVLVNNAGVMAPPSRSLSSDGHELQFAVNHLGHFALTLRLLGALSPSGRVVNISSVHHIRGRLVLSDVSCEHRPYDPIDAYCASKMANVHFTRELARRLRAAGRTTSTYCVNPGTVNTSLTRHVRGAQAVFFSLIGRLFNLDVVAGTQTTLHCCLESRRRLNSGAYYANCRQNDCLLHESTDRRMSAALWQRSLQLTHLEQTPI